MATIKRIAVPQDQMFVLPNGYINPAWYRFLLEIQKQFPELISLASQADATDEAVNTTNDLVAALDSRIGSLERNFQKDPVADVATSTLPVGATYTQTEIEAIEARIRDYGAAINVLNDRLEQSNIVRSS